MGAIRSFPDNHVNTLTEDHKDLYFATVSCCGWQHFMQDYEVSITDGPVKLFAIFDGHGGPECAEFCQKELPKLFQKSQLVKLHQYYSAIQNIISELQAALSKNHAKLNEIRSFHSLPVLPQNQYTKAGCSVAIVLISDEEIIISNIGECKCYVTYRKDQTKAILFSGNHTVTNKDEEARILKNGGYVLNGLINGAYSYTRSLGDFHLKVSDGAKLSEKKYKDMLISNQPQVFSLRKADIDRIVIGSKGSWQKPDIILKTMMDLGESAEQDRTILDKMVDGLIPKDPSSGEGLNNIMLTCISLK